MLRLGRAIGSGSGLHERAGSRWGAFVLFGFSLVCLLPILVLWDLVGPGLGELLSAWALLGYFWLVFGLLRLAFAFLILAWVCLQVLVPLGGLGECFVGLGGEWLLS